MKKWICLLLCTALLTGCQLARPEKNEDPRKDPLVGIFVTEKPLDLFDVESYLKEHPEDFLDGELEPPERGTLYATMEDDETFRFPGYEGMYLCCYLAEDGVEVGFNTEGLGDLCSSQSVTDTGKVVEETATIRIVPEEFVVFYTNPIYRSEDGRFYVVEGSGFQNNGGGIATQRISDTKTLTVDGVTQTREAAFAVSVECIEVADTVTLIQMSADNRELARQEYTPKTIPEKLHTEPGTAYILAECRTGDTLRRSLYEPGGEDIQVWYKTDTVVCLPRFTEVIWAE